MKNLISKSIISTVTIIWCFGIIKVEAQTSFNISNQTTGDTLFTIDNNGNVGIGTTTPGTSIDVNSSAVETASSFRLGNLDNSRFFRIYSGNATYSPLIRWHEGAALRFAAWTDTYTEIMRLTPDGNLGIGTTSPDEKLTLAYDNFIGWEYSESNSSVSHKIGKSSNGAGPLEFITTFNPGATGQTFTFKNPVDRLTILYNGNIGIGTTTPRTKLEVADTIRSSIGGFQFPDGTVQETAATGGSGNTLDQAYDQGGPGAGSTIIADNGPVNISGSGGLVVDGVIRSNSSIYTSGSGSEGGQISFNDGDGQGGWIIDNYGTTDSESFRIFRGGGFNNIFNALVINGLGHVGMGTGGPTADLHIDGIDGTLFGGTYGSGSIPVEGAGTRMMWYPAQAAFRAGLLSATRTGAWDADSIGAYSTALGYNTRASGSNGSIAMGFGPMASGNNASIALGFFTRASGQSSVAMGNYTRATGSNATAMGWETIASGNYSTALGYQTDAEGSASVAMGDHSIAGSNWATAMGYYTEANGSFATAMGRQTTAAGNISTAMGYQTNAHAYSSTALGRYNIGGGNSSSWVSTDPVFEIGIGSSSNSRANALTVIKNGNIGIGTTDPNLNRLRVVADNDNSNAIIGAIYPTGSESYAGTYGYAGGGTGTNYGLHGYAEDGDYNFGVYGGAHNASTDDVGVYGDAFASSTNYAGYFYGNVYTSGSSTKSIGITKIDHPLDPENKYLQHSSVESSEMMNVYNGNVILDANGEAEIELPDWFEAYNKDFRYQLTCIGGFAQVYISEEVENNRFKIAGGSSGMKVSWQITGVRKDRLAEQYPIVVEKEKSAKEKGKYIHPSIYGFDESQGIGFVNHRNIENKK